MHNAAENRRVRAAVTSKPGPVLVDTPRPLGEKLYVISIRPKRLEALRGRLGPVWSEGMEVVGVDGRRISRKAWEARGWVERRSRLKRGQLGCYASHVLVWKALMKEDITTKDALVLEDDATLFATPETKERLEAIRREITPDMHIVFLGHNMQGAGEPLSPQLERPLRSCMGLHNYYITREGASHLLSNVKLRGCLWPIDRVLGNHLGKFVAARATPPVSFVVGSEKSDTQGIY